MPSVEREPSVEGGEESDGVSRSASVDNRPPKPKPPAKKPPSQGPSLPSGAAKDTTMGTKEITSQDTPDPPVGPYSREKTHKAKASPPATPRKAAAQMASPSSRLAPPPSLGPQSQSGRSEPRTRLKQAQMVLYGRNFFSRPEAAFPPILARAEAAIEAGVYPERIVAGSSGSYFVLDLAKEKVGVFKPKNEEPFAHLNPKWPKFFQRTCSPCCFGRRCLLPNQGYLSEAGASLVDELLELNVVPKTKVVGLSAPTFYYVRKDRIKSELPQKLGSFQLFFKGAEDAGPVLLRLGYGDPKARTANTATEPALTFATPQLKKDFHRSVQKMIALDYIIRNTDRSGANWLIRLAKKADSSTVVEGLEIAVIDNGLAFPWKHPEDWRQYPFYWATLMPFCDEPFDASVAEALLPKLRSHSFLEALSHHLRQLFKMDAGYRPVLAERQMAVMRGQIWNLIRALDEKLTPRELASLRPLLVTPRRLRHVFRSSHEKEALHLCDLYKVRVVDPNPCFKSF